MTMTFRPPGRHRQRERRSAQPLEFSPTKFPVNTPTFSFAAVTTTRAGDEIARMIRELVASGQIKPGDRLPSERELAQRLHVSRNTLREALRALEHAGMIEMRKGATGGAFVLPGDSAAIVTGLKDLYHLGAITPEQLTDARIWISEAVVRVACQRADEEDFAALAANIAAATEAQRAGDFETRQRLNREFHVLLARATRNPIMIGLMEALMEVMGEFIKRIGPSDNPFVLPSRRRLLQHLRQREENKAVAEIVTSLTRLQDKYLALAGQQQLAGAAPARAAGPASVRRARRT